MGVAISFRSPEFWNSAPFDRTGDYVDLGPAPAVNVSYSELTRVSGVRLFKEKIDKVVAEKKS